MNVSHMNTCEEILTTPLVAVQLNNVASGDILPKCLPFRLSYSEVVQPEVLAGKQQCRLF
jgi:hypothetical protein